jgi:hypothetical protein
VATPIIVTIPHQLGRAEARRRIQTGFVKIVHALPGGAGIASERWDGDQLVFEVAAMGQTIAGVIDVLDTAVTMQIELPGVLGMIAGGLRDRLQKVGQLLLLSSTNLASVRAVSPKRATVAFSRGKTARRRPSSPP